jgi:hypothetical protein
MPLNSLAHPCDRGLTFYWRSGHSPAYVRFVISNGAEYRSRKTVPDAHRERAETPVFELSIAPEQSN